MERVDQAEAVNGYEASSSSGLWVFGYGSLCWNPGFEFRKSVTGCIKGFIRKFWQGNATHRGTEEKPGRVATLVEEKEGVVWGRAFLLQGEAALPYLTRRECQLGGYISTITTVYPQPGVDTKPFPALLYIATPNNRHWLGEAPLHEIACQIMESSGPSGHNVEYLLRLASFMKEQVPEAMDDHLFTLEIMVRSIVKDRNLCLKTLMGELGARRSPQPPPDQEGHDNNAAEVVRQDSFQFTSRVHTKKLRCLNI